MNRLSCRNFLLSFFIICLFNPAQSAFSQHVGLYFPEGKTKTSFSVQIINNLIVIPVLFGDQELNFILDTGVRSTILLNKDFATANGIIYHRKIELYGAGGVQPVNAFVTDEIALTIPGLKSGGISALVLEQDFLNLKQNLGVEIHGLIGYDIFSRFIVKINYLNEKVSILKPGTVKVKRNYLHQKLNIVESKPLVSLRLNIDARTSILANLLVDTGASHALVLDADSNPDIDIPENHIEASLGRGLSGEIYGYLGRVEQVDFGERKLNGVITSFPFEKERNSYPANRNGSIGGELLRKFHVIFDYPNSAVYLKPNKTYKFPFEYNMSGLEFIAQGNRLNFFMISNIRKNSAADNMGFLPGDVLISLNNIPSNKLDLTKIYSQLNDREGKKMSLTVYRDGLYISRTFYLKREI